MTNSKDEQEKLLLEIEVLKDRVVEIQKKNKKNTFGKKLIKDFNLATVLIIVTILVSAGGFYLQSRSFINERIKENEIKVEQHMLDLMTGLKEKHDSYEERDAILLLLTQYKMNAVPVLLLYLKYHAEKYKLVKEALLTIEKNVSEDEFMSKIIESSFILFNQMCSEKFDRNEPVSGLQAHIRLLKGFDNAYRKQISDSLVIWRSKLENIKKDTGCDHNCKVRIEKTIKVINGSSETE